MAKRVKSLDKMRDMLRKKSSKSEFDVIYLKSMDFYKDMGQKALRNLEGSSYYELCAIAERDKSFCHHDYTYHNIVLNEDNDVYVIDFDFCKREVRTFDISNFMIKVLKRVDWDINYARAIIDSYNSVSELNNAEYKVLFAYLQFPQRYWRLANRYYYNEVSWGQNTFYNKLQGIVDEREKYLKLLDEYEKEYLF